jgi:formylglycine-generating enzyme required for sulfatase activity
VGDTSEVGSYPSGVSPYGALDLAGNVWEWVADWYDSSYYSIYPDRNPTGPTSGDYRVLRGGSWNSSVTDVRSAVRQRVNPDFWDFEVGFRCALSPTP